MMEQRAEEEKTRGRMRGNAERNQDREEEKVRIKKDYSRGLPFNTVL